MRDAPRRTKNHGRLVAFGERFATEIWQNAVNKQEIHADVSRFYNGVMECWVSLVYLFVYWVGCNEGEDMGGRE